MILVDTSVWIYHLRPSGKTLTELLLAGKVITHTSVIGELALGNLRGPQVVLDALLGLPRSPSALDTEILTFIEQQALMGLRIGYVDTHLLVSARLLPGTLLWTYDKRLSTIAKRLGVTFEPPHRSNHFSQFDFNFFVTR
jgi:predicted nucleic acid-binding protein